MKPAFKHVPKFYKNQSWMMLAMFSGLLMMLQLAIIGGILAGINAVLPSMVAIPLSIVIIGIAWVYFVIVNGYIGARVSFGVPKGPIECGKIN